MKRSYTLKIRLSEEELCALKARSTASQLASWARQILLDEKPIKDLPIVEPKLLRQISAIGNNLNQVVRLANYSANIGERVSLIDSILITKATLEKILNLHRIDDDR